MLTENELLLRQNLSLNLKISKTLKTLEKFYYDHGNFYISVGGVDSTVLMYIARMSKIPGVANCKCISLASCEPPNNIKVNKENGVELLSSHVNKMKLIEKWGYPLINKEVAMKLSRYSRSKNEWAKNRRLYGYKGLNGKWIYDSRIPLKYQSLIYAPFELSEHCCIEMKEKPLKKFEKQMNLLPVTGEMAIESINRKRQYLKNGCIRSNSKRIKCTPLGFWTHSDIVEFCEKYNVNYSKDYGNIVNGEFTGEKRTGCVFCGFGILNDKDRFIRMKKRNSKLYSYMFNGGKFIRKNKYRWVRFRKNGILIWSNLYFVPSNEGYGFRFIIRYLNDILDTDILY